MTQEEQTEMIALRNVVAHAWTYLDYTERLLTSDEVARPLAWHRINNDLDEAISLVGMFAGARHHIKESKVSTRVLRNLVLELHARAEEKSA